MATVKKPLGPTPYSFLSGWVQDRNTVRVTAQIDSLAEAGSTLTNVMKWLRPSGQWEAFCCGFRAVRIGLTYGPTPHAFFAGSGGDICVVNPQGGREEHVDPTNDGPVRRGDIVDLRVIGGEVYCAGMGRQVYKRLGKDRWEHIDTGAVQPRGVIEVSGFNCIDGVSSELLYAAGFNGEIWRRAGTQWSRMPSPTNVVLNWIRVIEPNKAFCAGQLGVLLEYDGTQWRVIDLGGFNADIWSIEWFGGNLYLGTEAGLFCLSPGSVLDEVNGLPEKRKVCYELHARDGVMVAVGPKYVWITMDGGTWEDITP
jgi:hypothetical protein